MSSNQSLDFLKKKIKKDLEAQVFSELKGKTESLEIGLIFKNEKVHFSWGKKYKYYDLASLTKVIFTVSAFILLEESNPGTLEKRVDRVLPWIKSNKNIKDFLAHQSGYPALYPVFNQLEFSTFESLHPLYSHLKSIRPNEKASVYSDVGFLILGAVLEELNHKNLYHCYQDVSKIFMSQQIHFLPLNKAIKKSVKDYAPTEKCKKRKKLIQAEVHDENSWRMGGVAPHAGLFGGIGDVLLWLDQFNKILKGKFEISKQTAHKFLVKQKGDWAVGLMKPSRPVSSCGKYFSDQSYGHLGFTGVSFWVDPVKDVSVVILSNRTFPDRENKSFNQFRPLIHDIIMKNLGFGDKE